jgi:hypothetical protein
MFDWLFGGSKGKNTTSAPKSTTTSAPKSTSSSASKSSYSDDSESGFSSGGWGTLFQAIAMVGVGMYQANRASKDAKKMADAISNNTVQTPVEAPSPTLAQETVVKSTKDTRRKVAANKGIFTKQEDGFTSNASLVRKTILGG